MFIGEAPGYYEDQQGLPFVGAAGKFLNELLASAGMSREQVYICNVIKCRPPGNRDPMPPEIEACGRWLDFQLAHVRPKVIVTLGRYSMARYFPKESISKIHGVPKKINGTIVYPLHHPAAALHQHSIRPIIEADFKRIPALLKEAMQSGVQAKPPEPQQKPQQMTLF